MTHLINVSSRVNPQVHGLTRLTLIYIAWLMGFFQFGLPIKTKMTLNVFSQIMSDWNLLINI
jgi:hypothetical protein